MSDAAGVDFKMQEVRLSSGPVSYQAAGDGRPLVHFHSAGGGRMTMPLQGLALRHKVYLPVAPGYDGTPLCEARSMRDLARVMAEFIEATVGGPCDVMGQSFGGWLALWLAVERPDLVEQLVLQCPAGLRPDGRGGLPTDPAELRRKLYAYPDRAPPEARSPEQLTANRAVPSHYHQDASFDRDLADRLGDIQARTLILFGTRDEIIPQDTAVLLKERIPQSHLTYIYDAAHALDVDQPARLLRIVAAFLERGQAFIVRESSEVA